MRPTLILLTIASLAFGNLIFERNNGPPGCNADNCARAVTGTRNGPATVYSHQADCKSFMQVTKYKHHPPTSPTAVPTYATACSGGVRYSSACSCWGFPVVTVYPKPGHGHGHDNDHDDDHHDDDDHGR
ncbi:hypothetical protein BGZ57DRAFT_853064 [Hyaloscypha finlandica]|nr:hypothetical protein BGZ57DRAFT_853064 [Hyaloscypha finlandica]